MDRSSHASSPESSELPHHQPRRGIVTTPASSSHALSTPSQNTFYTASIYSGFSYITAQSHLSEFSEAKRNLEIAEELDWSGKGQHVSFTATEQLPFTVEPTAIDKGSTAIIDIVQCRRIRLVRKLIRCKPSFPLEEALREVASLQRLRHAHIIRVVGSYYKGRDLGLLLYPIAEKNLADYLDELGQEKLPESKIRCWDFAGCLVHALRYIHQNQIKHLDIKPSNILIKRNYAKDQDQVYIADFGASKCFEGDSQTRNEVWQTAKYRSPEVADFENKGRASDIFSLGCVLVEILTVAAGNSLERLAKTVWGVGNRQEYHLSINGIHSWIREVAAEFVNCNDLSTDVLQQMQKLEIQFAGVKALSSMLKRDPERRATAGLLFPMFTVGLCCTKGPEPFVTLEDTLLEAATRKVWDPIEAVLRDSIPLSRSASSFWQIINQAVIQEQERTFMSLLQISGMSGELMKLNHPQIPPNQATIDSTIEGLLLWESITFPRRPTEIDAYSFEEYQSQIMIKGRNYFTNWVYSAKSLHWKGGDGTALLHWACQTNNPDLLSYLIQKGAKANVDNPFLLPSFLEGSGSLIVDAVAAGASQVLKILVENGEDIEYQVGGDAVSMIKRCLRLENGGLGQTPTVLDGLYQGTTEIQCSALHLAVCRRDATQIRMILDCGADVDAQITILEHDETEKRKSGPAALTLSTIMKDYKITAILLGCGANVDLRDDHGTTPLLRALRSKDWSMMETLVYHGANIDVRDDHGITPLMHALRVKDRSMIETLFNYGADINIQDDRGKTHLMHVAQTFDTGFFDFLLGFTPAIDIQDNEGKTVLDYAVDNPDALSLVALLSRRANVNITEEHGKILLMKATGHQRDPSLYPTWFRHFKPVINMPDSDGIATVEFSFRDSLLDLGCKLENGANINSQDIEGKTMLMHACQKAEPLMVRFLLCYNPAINLQDRDGDTALIEAARTYRKESITLLIEAGADLSIRNRNGMTALGLVVLLGIWPKDEPGLVHPSKDQFDSRLASRRGFHSSLKPSHSSIVAHSIVAITNKFHDHGAIFTAEDYRALKLRADSISVKMWEGIRDTLTGQDFTLRIQSEQRGLRMIAEVVAEEESRLMDAETNELLISEMKGLVESGLEDPSQP